MNISAFFGGRCVSHDTQRLVKNVRGKSVEGHGLACQVAQQEQRAVTYYHSLRELDYLSLLSGRAR